MSDEFYELKLKNDLKCANASTNFDRVTDWTKKNNRRIAAVEERVKSLPTNWQISAALFIVIALQATAHPVIAKALIKFL